MAGVAAVIRIVGFAVQAACEDNAWLNVLQYAVPLGVTAWALRSIFRQRAGRSVDRRPRLAAAAPAAA